MARPRRRRHIGFQEVPVDAGAVIARDDMVMLVGGFAQPAAADANNQGVRGIAEEAADNTGGAAGAITVKIWEGIITVPAAGMAQSDVGTTAYASSGVQVSGVQGLNEPVAGPIRRFRSATEVDIEVSWTASQYAES